MRLFLRARAWFSSAILSCGVLAGCASSGAATAPVSAWPPPGAAPFVGGALREVQRRPPVAGHVYVLDPGAKAVFRFPIVNGIVGSQPDSTLSLPSPKGLVAGLGLAVGRDGTQYLSDYYNTIYVFPPGAHGNDGPVRTIRTPYRPEKLVVDANGYLYANQFSNGHSQWEPLVVIAPDGHVVQRIKALFGLTYEPEGVDAQGNLYVDVWKGRYENDVYATPITNPTLIRTSCLRRYYALTESAVSDGQLFVGWHGVITRAHDTTTACPAPPEPERFLIVPYTSPGIGVYFDLTVADHHIFIAPDVTLEGGPARLLEFDADKGGRQPPLADVRWSGFRSPSDVATGP
jgi:hypothetical protein